MAGLEESSRDRGAMLEGSEWYYSGLSFFAHFWPAFLYEYIM